MMVEVSVTILLA